MRPIYVNKCIHVLYISVCILSNRSHIPRYFGRYSRSFCPSEVLSWSRIVPSCWHQFFCVLWRRRRPTRPRRVFSRSSWAAGAVAVAAVRSPRSLQQVRKDRRNSFSASHCSPPGPAGGLSACPPSGKAEARSPRCNAVAIDPSGRALARRSAGPIVDCASLLYAFVCSDSSDNACSEDSPTIHRVCPRSRGTSSAASPRRTYRHRRSGARAAASGVPTSACNSDNALIFGRRTLFLQTITLFCSLGSKDSISCETHLYLDSG